MGKRTRAGKSVVKIDEITEGFQEIIDNRLEAIDSQLDSQEKKLIELAIENSYLQQRRSLASNFFLECFFDQSQTEDIEDGSNKITEVMDDTDWNNNWKIRDDDPIFKNGFLRPRKQPYMLEIIDKYNLRDVGDNEKAGLSNWDAINECYWLLTAKGIENAYPQTGEILKININKKTNEIEILAKYLLPNAHTEVASSTFWKGLASDGSKLYFCAQEVQSGSVSGTSTLFSIKINPDGTLGESGYKVSNGEFIDITNSIENSRVISGTGNDKGAYTDVVIWDDNNIMALAVSPVSASPNVNKVSLIALSKSDLTSTGATIIDITGLEHYTDPYQSTVTTDFGRSVTKDGDTLWLRTLDPMPYGRYIIKINIPTDICSSTGLVLKISNRFLPDKIFDTGGTEYTYIGEAIAISAEGDFLEVNSKLNSVSYDGRYIARRAIKNAVLSENIAGDVIKINKANPTNQIHAFGLDGNNHAWYNTNISSLNNIKLAKVNLTTGAESYLTLTSGGWASVHAIHIAYVSDQGEDYFFLIGEDNSSNFQFRAISRTDMEAALALGSMDISATGNAFYTPSAYIDVTHVRMDITSDGNFLYIINDDTNIIEQWSLSAIPEPTRYGPIHIALPDSISNYFGITWANNKFYVSYIAGATSHYILEISDKAQTDVALVPGGGITAEILHRYKFGYALDIVFAMEAQGTTLWCIDGVKQHIVKLETLDNPNILQLQTFIDHTTNKILSNNVTYVTPIATRYFDSTDDYADIRDIPDKNYCVVTYAEDGFSILHLDDYLSDITSTGLHRYDVRKIRADHYLRGTNNLIEEDSTDITSVAAVDKELIFIGRVNTTNNYLIDLKAGKATLFSDSSSNTSGYEYQGSLSERNEAKGYSGKYRENIELYAINVRSLHVRTFTKEDISDYAKENPKTFFLIGKDNDTDILEIDWDNNGNRTPRIVWGAIWNDTTAGTGIYGGWIAPSGKVFGAQYSANGKIFYGNYPIWDLAQRIAHPVTYAYNILDTDASTEIGTNIIQNYITDIAPNSRCWKTASGEWRHQLLCSVFDDSATADHDAGMLLIDVERASTEWIIRMQTSSDSDYEVKRVDIFEDKVFGISNTNISSTPLTDALFILQKIRFHDTSPSSWLRNYWTKFVEAVAIAQPSMGMGITAISKPLFPAFNFQQEGLITGCRYSPDHNTLAISSSIEGVQFLHFTHLDECIHQSTELDCENPSEIFYKQNANIPENGERVTIVPKNDSNITYGTGWINTNINDPEPVTINRDGISFINKQMASSPWYLVMYDIVFGNNLFVSVGNCHEIQISSTGETWTHVDADGTYPASTDAFLGITFGNDIFVVVGSKNNAANGDIQVSSTGLTWTELSIGSTQVINGIAYGNGLFVTAGNNKEILVSSTGLTWTTITLSGASSTAFNGITFGNGLFILLGDGPEILVSSTGLTWTQATIDTFAGGSSPNAFYAAAYGNGLYIASGSNGEFQYSSTGLTWTHVDIDNTNSANYYYIKLKFLNGLFIANGLEQNYTFPADIQISSTGLVWARKEQAPRHIPGDLTTGAYGNNKLVFVSLYGSGAQVATMYDPDTLGELTWDNIVGYTKAGISFRTDEAGGVALITVTDETTSTGVTGWDQREFYLYSPQSFTYPRSGERVCWIEFPDPTHTYSIKVDIKKEHIPDQDSRIIIQQFLLVEDLINPAELEVILNLYHENWSSVIRQYILTPDAVQDIEQITKFNGDDNTTVFSLNGNDHASEPIAFSKDGGSTWLLPESVSLTWGDNPLNYDNETVNSSTGYFSVNFEEAPVTGTENVQIKWRPAYNKAYVKTTLKHANDGIDYVKDFENIRLLDHAIELI